MQKENKTPSKSQLAAGLVAKYPEAKSQTLARMLYHENSLLFNSVEAARSVIRYVRGASGRANKRFAEAKFSESFKPVDAPGDPFAKLPDALTHFDDISPIVLPTGTRVGLMSDIHIPYHDSQALLVALNALRDRNPDVIVLNGDVADFFAVSFWEKDPKKRDLRNEIHAVRQFLSVLREAFPKARIIYKEGNHEERWTRYLSVKAPELLGMDEFALPAVLHFDKHGIEFVGDKRMLKAGKLFIGHGHEFRFAIANPVNAARGFYLKAKTQFLGGHLHQTSSHSEKTIDDVVISSWSVGCLCDLHPDYSPFNNWSHSFGVIEIDSDNNFEVQLSKIIHGRVYHA